jgi:hypothetical protein
MQTAMYQRIGNMPKACPYVMMHKVNQNQGNTDNLISEYLFFAEGDRFLGSVEKYWGTETKT